MLFSSIFVSIGFGFGRYLLLMLGLSTQLSFFYLKGDAMNTEEYENARQEL
jgi:hypothetical protein